MQRVGSGRELPSLRSRLASSVVWCCVSACSLLLCCGESCVHGACACWCTSKTVDTDAHLSSERCLGGTLPAAPCVTVRLLNPPCFVHSPPCPLRSVSRSLPFLVFVAIPYARPSRDPGRHCGRICGRLSDRAVVRLQLARRLRSERGDVLRDGVRLHTWAVTLQQ